MATMTALRPGAYGFPVSIRPRYDNFIGGEWVAPASGQYFENVTPVTGQVLCEIPRSNAADIDRALDAAHAAKTAWGKTSQAERARLLEKIASRMEENLEMLATIEDDHFWFVPRNRLLAGLLERYFPSARTVLELGCGNGAVLSALSRDPKARRPRAPVCAPSRSDTPAQGLRRARATPRDPAHRVRAPVDPARVCAASLPRHGGCRSRTRRAQHATRGRSPASLPETSGHSPFCGRTGRSVSY